MPQLPSVSAARSSAALPVAPAPVSSAPSSTPAPRQQQKKNEWEDDWDSLLNDKCVPPRRVALRSDTWQACSAGHPRREPQPQQRQRASAQHCASELVRARSA